MTMLFSTRAALKTVSIGSIALLSACSYATDQEAEQREDSEMTIVDVPHTDVERQSIGNCWIYASAGWAESMHKAATGNDLDLSQSYWTYLHWFDQITYYAGMDSNEISTGGHWSAIREIIQKYGTLAEADFISDDTKQEQSYRQSQALAAINRALAEGGALATAEDRQDREKVRRTLDEAWRLPEETRQMLDSVFGPAMDKTFRGSANAEGTPIVPASEITAKYPVGPNPGKVAAPGAQTLATAIGEWREISYPSSASARRATLKRMQAALHESAPVVIRWFVDFNALESNSSSALYGSFNLETLERAGRPGNQGGHMTVLEDYEALVPAGVERFNESGEVIKSEWIHYEPYHVDVAGPVKVVMTGTGDADLHVRVGAQPTAKEWNCRPYRAGSQEECVVTGPADIYVSVLGWATRSTFAVETSYASGTEVLAADVTLDPENPEDAAKLAAALDDAAQIRFLRVKNSWGANRAGLAFAPGPHSDVDGSYAKGYHDLYMDYLNGPIAEADKCTETSCPKNKTPLQAFVVPPGF